MISNVIYKGFACACVCACVCADGSGAPKAAPLPGAECCGVDTAFLWHPAGFLLPPLHPALQKQQVLSRLKCILCINTHTHIYLLN